MDDIDKYKLKPGDFVVLNEQSPYHAGLEGIYVRKDGSDCIIIKVTYVPDSVKRSTTIDQICSFVRYKISPGMKQLRIWNV